MFSNKRVLNLCKVIVVLLILIFCLIPYFRSNKLDNSIGNNEEIEQEGNVNNDEFEEEVDNDGDKEEQDVNDKDVDNTLNNDSAGKDNNTESNNEDKNINSDVEISKDNNVSNKKITLVDKTNGASCAQAIEYFYQDNQYRYYFACIKSNSMYVIVNGVEYKLVYALENDIVTIGELESNGYRFLKESKNLQDK